MSGPTLDWRKAIPDPQTISAKWTSDLEKLKLDLESIVHDLTHLEVELRIEGQTEPIRKTELNLITGDITVTLPSKPSEDEIDKIYTAATIMAREELKERIDTLLKLVEILIDAVSPSGPLKKVLDATKAAIEKLPSPE